MKMGEIERLHAAGEAGQGSQGRRIAVIAIQADLTTEIEQTEDLEIEAWGNVLLGLGFWIGLAEEELPRRAFERFDPSYACGVMIRATKPA